VPQTSCSTHLSVGLLSRCQNSFGVQQGKEVRSSPTRHGDPQQIDRVPSARLPYDGLDKLDSSSGENFSVNVLGYCTHLRMC
jgi:hypothetical protein